MKIVPKLIITTFQLNIETTLSQEYLMELISNKALEAGYIIKNESNIEIKVRPRFISHWFYHPHFLVWNSSLTISKAKGFELRYNIFHPILPVILIILITMMILEPIFPIFNASIVLISIALFYQIFIVFSHRDFMQRILKEISRIKAYNH